MAFTFVLASNSDIFCTTKSRSCIWANRKLARPHVIRTDLSTAVLDAWFSALSTWRTSRRGITKRTKFFTYNQGGEKKKHTKSGDTFDTVTHTHLTLSHTHTFDTVTLTHTHTHTHIHTFDTVTLTHTHTHTQIKHTFPLTTLII